MNARSCSLLFFLLAFLATPWLSSPITRFIPGWHAWVMSPYFFLSLLIVAGLLAISIAYWRLGKDSKPVSRPLFSLHFFLSIPGVIFSSDPYFVPEMLPETPLVLELQKNLHLEQIVTIVELGCFLAGQIIFGVLYNQALKVKGGVMLPGNMYHAERAEDAEE